ncbi:MAG: hypothetical protein COX80_01900 [Candidatus Magasanikbacteria bacterium CG_4_10_14_0_2_um_filter_33_14]|uniref:Addiction module toxin RelE n=1 Tax=Candidatus Magasanikbacteria bacterium CG_4_10_14_0_2_um_filter_33_14 TaxID=1974636 RepID=A0A2M7VB42_9BACT|nr:MAG: hypothetical protein COX80_01900 [Candidatus Magasanikbacteria bacterium CG_4_10_14_0_2_um_filter_33_14]
MLENYSVFIEQFAERHYIKSFEKKYKRAWDITQKALLAQFERIDMLLKRDIAETIVDAGKYKIIKTDFSVAGTNKSPKSAGNRCIVIVDEEVKKVSILLVYHKNDLVGSGNETALWKQVIKNNYREYSNLL